MSRTTPETKFSQNPNHITGKNRFISSIGTPGATPRIRSASTALMPAARPMPTVWHDRTAGNANTDGDSRTQMLSDVASIHARNGSMVAAARILNPRPCDPEDFLNSPTGRVILTASMRSRAFLSASLAAAALVSAAAAQDFTPKVPTPADWAALGRLPDFTGVWETGTVGGGGRAGGGRAGAAGGGGAAPARGRAAAAPAGPSLTPAYAAMRKARQDANAEDNLTANCLPPGMPLIMGQPYPMEFLLSPGLVTIVIEAYQQVRHIYTDGRPLPADPDPTFKGTSIGRWEGSTLVAETIGFSPDTMLAANTPHGDKMRI